MLFYLFLDEWVKHVQRVTGANFSSVDWPTIRGFRAFVPAYIYAMNRCTNGFTKDVQDCSCSMLLTEPSLINFFLRHLYSHTSVFDVFATVSKLKKPFNHYFCNQIDLYIFF